ncbi:MAG TPA: FKBP-type peptidyl-prolyl cis-trans isomerase [Actinocrinis sp.]|nr:FKBP-type peptidyl-prolyl cis-trans isomerase [Actinocrinis sp.]
MRTDSLNGGARGRALAGCLAALLLGAAASACSSSAAASPGGPAAAGALPKVSGAVGQEATIVLPANTAAPAELSTRILVQGSGSVLAAGELAAVNYTAMDWTGAKMLGTTYSEDGGKTPNQPQVVTLGTSGLLSAWNTALVGARVGSRIEVVSPPADAFGSAGNSKAGVAGSDDLVFVLDVVGGYPANADITGAQAAQTDAALPKITGEPGTGNPAVAIPAGVAPPTTLVSDVLIKGTGAAVAKGQTLVLQYTGVDWNTGKNFDSSFTRKQAYGVVIGAGQVIPGWDTGLVGKHVGDRVLLVIPPADGYGPSGGRPTAGIGAKDTLVFVVDIVDAL